MDSLPWINEHKKRQNKILKNFEKEKKEETKEAWIFRIWRIQAFRTNLKQAGASDVISVYMSVDCIYKFQAQLFHKRNIPVHSPVDRVYQLYENYLKSVHGPRIQLEKCKSQKVLYHIKNFDQLFFCNRSSYFLLPTTSIAP